MPDPPLAGAASLSFQFGELVNNVKCWLCPRCVCFRQEVVKKFRHSFQDEVRILLNCDNVY